MISPHDIQGLLGFAPGGGNGAPYLFWSGIFSDVTIFGGVALFLRSRNCHVKGCWRHGHGVPGTPYVACHHHHPTLRRSPTPAHIAEAHRLAQNSGDGSAA